MPTAANEGKWRPTKNRCVFYLYCTFYFLFFNYYEAHKGQQRPTQANAGQRRPTAANEGQWRPTTANAGQRSQRKPTQASPPRPRRTFIGFFFSLHKSCLCLLTYVIIKFLGFNGVVNIVVVVYVDSEFLTSMYYDPSTPGHPLQKTRRLTGWGSHGFGCGSLGIGT